MEASVSRQSLEPKPNPSQSGPNRNNRRECQTAGESGVLVAVINNMCIYIYIQFLP